MIKGILLAVLGVICVILFAMETTGRAAGNSTDEFRIKFLQLFLQQPFSATIHWKGRHKDLKDATPLMQLVSKVIEGEARNGHMFANTKIAPEGEISFFLEGDREKAEKESFFDLSVSATVNVVTVRLGDSESFHFNLDKAIADELRSEIEKLCEMKPK